MAIRTIQEHDIDECLSIYKNSILHKEYGYSAPNLKEFLENPAHHLILHETDKINGWAWAESKAAFARSPYLRLICVDKESTGKGIGKLLLEEIERRCNSASGLFLLTTSQNTSAKKFYESLGYEKVGQIPNYVLDGVSEDIYWKSPARI